MARILVWLWLSSDWIRADRVKMRIEQDANEILCRRKAKSVGERESKVKAGKTFTDSCWVLLSLSTRACEEWVADSLTKFSTPGAKVLEKVGLQDTGYTMLPSNSGNFRLTLTSNLIYSSPWKVECRRVVGRENNPEFHSIHTFYPTHSTETLLMQMCRRDSSWVVHRE
jgi:hypothetical protein